MGTVNGIARNPYLKSVMYRYVKTALWHPIRMGREHSRCFRQWLLGPDDIPAIAKRMEIHSHTHFSGLGCANAEDIIPLLMESIHIWSPTDYNTTALFKCLASGKLDLARKYGVEVQADRRSLRISDGDSNMIILRSMEARTNKGHLGLHGFSGKPPRSFDYEDTLKFAFDNGAFVVLNHPYFWNGVGWNGNDSIDTAVRIASNKNGLLALEKNAAEIPPQIYSPVLAEIMAKKLGIPLVASGDAHTLGMYGRAGIAFPLQMSCIASMANPVEEISGMIRNSEFTNYFNYSTPKEFLGFFRF
ncbi:MAG: hypothetical protein PHV13_05035 [Candidatus ainarchaeum sp.]|nr:hypothetical protein [Candidatus ainarchaeum sp.]